MQQITKKSRMLFVFSCMEIRTGLCSASSMLAKHELLDLVEGNSWVRCLDHGPFSDVIFAFSQQAGLPGV